MASPGKCLICEGVLSEGVTREVKEKGVITLIDFSVKWKDGKHSLLEGLKSVTVHENVGKYIRKKEVLKLFNQDIKPVQILSKC